MQALKAYKRKPTDSKSLYKNNKKRQDPKSHKSRYKNSSNERLKRNKNKTKKNYSRKSAKKTSARNSILHGKDDDKIPHSPSTDSVIYVGTFYYSFPVVDLTKSDSSLLNTMNTNHVDVQIENNLQQGDSTAITGQLPVITIRPPSAGSLISSASENTIYPESLIKANENVIKHNTPSNLSRSELKLHHSYPLNQDAEISSNVTEEILNEVINITEAKMVIQEIIDNLPDIMEPTNNNKPEIVQYPEIIPMDVDEISCEKIDINLEEILKPIEEVEN